MAWTENMTMIEKTWLGSGGSAFIADESFISSTYALPGTTGTLTNGACISGTLNRYAPVAASQLPNPTASTLGGIVSIVAAAHQWIDSISTSGVPHQSQPGFSDISGTASLSQLPGAGATTVAGQNCSLGSTCGLATTSNVLPSLVSLNNISNYFDGPSMTQGTAGTWFASGSVSVSSTDSGWSIFRCKLWDGHTLISQGEVSYLNGQMETATLTLSGSLVSPADNIRVSCRDISGTNGSIISSLGGVSNASCWDRQNNLRCCSRKPGRTN